MVSGRGKSELRLSCVDPRALADHPSLDGSHRAIHRRLDVRAIAEVLEHPE
jgi:hypothetical protein